MRDVVGSYELLDEIGAGGFGRVYRARHVELEEVRAVKIATDPEFVRQLRKEGRVLSRLRHPRTVLVYDMSTAHEPPYIVMEYVEGEDLSKRLERGPLPVDDTVQIMLDVLEALEHAHGEGVIHRDVKPSNILLDREGRAKVSDFGLGRVVEQASKSWGRVQSLRSGSGEISGTLKYMSPEQLDPSLLKGEEPDGRSDLYSLGLVLYEMLTGEFPVGTRPLLPSEMRSEVDGALDEVFVRCTAGQREQRPGSAGEVVELVRGALKGEEAVVTGADPSLASQVSLGHPASAEAGEVWVSPADGKEMVYVPAGEFLMGSDESDVGAFPDEHPQRRVYLDAFWIDKCEVTVKEYRRFCEATGRRMPEAPEWGWEEDHPIVNVSWHDAVAYAEWAGKRLPTEAEWEKAARGTDGRKYPWGNGEPGSNRCNLTGDGDGYEYTAPVGSFPSGASPYGCLDMAGNVWEWCADWYDGDYYEKGPDRNPRGPSSGNNRVVRGGSWSSSSGYVRCANRSYFHPSGRALRLRVPLCEGLLMFFPLFFNAFSLWRGAGAEPLRAAQTDVIVTDR